MSQRAISGCLLALVQGAQRQITKPIRDQNLVVKLNMCKTFQRSSTQITVTSAPLSNMSTLWYKADLGNREEGLVLEVSGHGCSSSPVGHPTFLQTSVSVRLDIRRALKVLSILKFSKKFLLMPQGTYFFFFFTHQLCSLDCWKILKALSSELAEKLS